MTTVVELVGNLFEQGQGCSSSTAGNGCPIPLGLGAPGCPGKVFYESTTQQDGIRIETAGAIGQNFVDIDCLDSFAQIELLYLRSTAEVAARLNAVPAVFTGSGATFPTGFSGGETLTPTIDTTTFVVTFDAADQNIEQVLARMNAAAALAGLSTPVFTAVSNQIQARGSDTSSATGTISFAGAGAVQDQLGLTNGTLVAAQGRDIPVNGSLLLESPRIGDNVLTKVQISGQAVIDVYGAGRTSV
jgi:hypothetical protein